MSLTRDDFLKPRRPPHEEVAVPELGGTVIVQGMTVAMRDRFLKALAADRTAESAQQVGYSTLLLLWSLANEDGTLLCTPADAALLGQLPSGAIDALVVAAERCSGLMVKLPAPKDPAPEKN